MIIDEVLEKLLKESIDSTEEMLRFKLEGGESVIRNKEFLSNNFKLEELISPPAGLYKVNKEMEEWTKKNVSAPGMDPDELKKKVWKKHSEEMAKEISKQVTSWLRDDLDPLWTKAIDSQIKLIDITITIPPGGIVAGAYPTAVPTVVGALAPIPSEIIVT